MLQRRLLQEIFNFTDNCYKLRSKLCFMVLIVIIGGSSPSSGLEYLDTSDSSQSRKLDQRITMMMYGGGQLFMWSQTLSSFGCFRFCSHYAQPSVNLFKGHCMQWHIWFAIIDKGSAGLTSFQRILTWSGPILLSASLASCVLCQFTG